MATGKTQVKLRGRAGAAQAIVTGLRQLFSNSSHAKTAAARFGLSAKSSVDDLVKFARNNKLLTAWVVYDVYGVGSELWDMIIEEYPEAAELVTLLAPKHDSVRDAEGNARNIFDLTEFHDEFQLISNVARKLGGMESFLQLRSALMVDAEVLQLYLETKRIALTI